MLGGANAALVGDEIVQFATAELIGPARSRLSRFLGGERGTEQGCELHAG